jgi:anti-sigma-K factor RskA
MHVIVSLVTIWVAKRARRADRRQDFDQSLYLWRIVYLLGKALRALYPEEFLSPEDHNPGCVL